MAGDRSVRYVRRQLPDHDHVSELTRIIRTPQRTPPGPVSNPRMEQDSSGLLSSFGTPPLPATHGKGREEARTLKWNCISDQGPGTVLEH
jgi:hypothetical protein